MSSCWLSPFSHHTSSLSFAKLTAGVMRKRKFPLDSLLPAHQSQTKYFRQTFRQIYLWPHQLQKRMTKSEIRKQYLLLEKAVFMKFIIVSFPWCAAGAASWCARDGSKMALRCSRETCSKALPLALSRCS